MFVLLPDAHPPKKEVQAYASRFPDVYGFSTWQWVTLSFTLLGIQLLHLLSLPFLAKAAISYLILAPTLIVLLGLTRHGPLDYVRFLGTRPPSKPPVRVLSALNGGALHVDFFGQEKIVVGCAELAAEPDLDHPDVKKVKRFLVNLWYPVQFVVTTGRPSCDEHHSYQPMPHCFIMTDVRDENPQATAVQLQEAMKRTELILKPMDPLVFEPSAGHGLTSAHYLVEKLPFKLELGCFRELSSLPCDFTAVVTISPGSLEQQKSDQAEEQNFMKAMMLTGISRNLTAGRKMPFEVSTNIIFVAKGALKWHDCHVQIRALAARKNMTVRYTRARNLPFSAVFCEPFHYYPLIVNEEGATALCPFFLDAPRTLSPYIPKKNL